MDWKDFQMIKNTYWEQTAALWIDGEVTPSKKNKIKCGVKQECALSLDLFSV